MSDVSGDRLRIDRWLWFARFYRTRTLASDAVAGGHVRVNGARANPGQRIACGDRISLVKDQLPWEFEVMQIPARRGPASEAGQCYVENDTTRARREALRRQIGIDRRLMPRTEGRPDKRTRRLLRQRQRGD